MLREYDCWLQKRRVETDIKIQEVVISKIKGIIAKQAIKELINGIDRLLGIKPKINYKKAVPPCNLCGFFAVTRSVRKSHAKHTQKRCVNEFAIKFIENQIHITASDESGLLYGVFRFLSLLTLGKIKPGFELNDSPASSLRIINHWDDFNGKIERGYAGGSLFYKDGKFNYDKKRIEDYARLLASIGINRLSINNVNVKNEAKELITKKYLKHAAKLAAIFRKFGIRLFFCIHFGAPISVGKLETADPLATAVQEWWKKKAALVYKYIPDFAGFLVKADSEGKLGPFQYGRTHADGANMLAKALEPFGADVIWRCFVYNCEQNWRDKNTDRARAAYDHFMPLDGLFSKNVILQIKHGPLDFQVREPVTPLFGALKKTRYIMELQITQEYTGHQIDLCYLPFMWEDIMNFDTAHGENSKINELVSSSCLEGFAAVVNVGLDNNWTGHTLAQANLYGYGRLAWNPKITAREIAQQWSVLSFGKNSTAFKIEDLLMRSYSAYEKYTAPFGICFMVTTHTHYGPNIEGYEFSRWGTYHRADKDAIGVDRTKSGTGYAEQYSEKNALLFSDPEACPDNLLLFFHRLRYDHKMKNGESLLQNIYDSHFEGCDEAETMLNDWKSLKSNLEDEVYNSVLKRFEKQVVNAREWRDQINTYFYRKTGIEDKQGRKIYE